MKIFLALLFLSLPTYAQYLHRSNPGTPGATAQTITTAGSGNCPGTGCVTVNTEGANTLTATVTGTYSGTLSAICSNDVLATVSALPATFVANQTGTFVIPNPGCRIVGIYASAWTSGTASVRLDADPSQPNAIVPALTGAFAVTGTLTTITTDTVSINLSGTQWATVQFKATTAGTSKQNAQVSIDGGTNWFAPAYAKKLSAVSANPTFTDFSVSGGVTMVANDLWEIPLPGNATNFRLQCGTTGTATTAVLSGGVPYVPGVPVVATLYDVTSAVNTLNATGVLDVSGWNAHYVSFSAGGATTVALIGATVADDGFNVEQTTPAAYTNGSGKTIVTAAVAGTFTSSRFGGPTAANTLIPTRRLAYSLAATAGQQTRLRVEAYR